MNLVVAPIKARIACFAECRIYIPRGNRLCDRHMLHQRLYEEEIAHLKIVSPVSLIPVDELNEFICAMSDVNTDKSIFDRIADHTLCEEHLKVFTGLCWENVICLRQLLTSVKDTNTRTVTQALVVFLMKLRTGNSNKLIAATLNIQREQAVSEDCGVIEKAFVNDILADNFGFKAHSREELIELKSSVADKLHNIGNKLAVTCDGTYLRHNKSANNVYQKKSYSGQKKTHLCKPFTICTTNGYVTDVAGPFTANLNDAEILRRVLNAPNGFRELLRPGDIFILDRGFRDVVAELRTQGFTVLMPALKGNRAQLSSKEANDSRLVTKVRWVVEAVHGAIAQKFKLLHHQLHNHLLTEAKTLCQIACYLHNKFGQRLYSDVKYEKQILRQIQETKNNENEFAEEVMDQGWNRKKRPFELLRSSDLENFPILSEAQMKILFTGSYQYAQALSYLSEMMTDENEIMARFLREHTEDSEVIRLEIPSRHKRAKIYKTYVKYQPKRNDIDGILGYACDCANGLRTVGCCAHTAAIIFYLSYGRYLSRHFHPAEKLTGIFESEGTGPVIAEDDSDDDQ